MKKSSWKKVLAITTYCIVIACILALGICFLIQPNETKAFCNVIIEWINKPLFVAGGCTITFGVILLLIVKETSFGKTSVNKVKREFTKVQSESESFKEQVYEKFIQYIESVDKKIGNIDILKEENKAILSEFSTRIDNLATQMIKVCETSPNAKIKALANEIKDCDNQIKQETSKEIAKIDSDLDKYLGEKNKVLELESKIEKIERLLEQYGEERVND